MSFHHLGCTLLEVTCDENADGIGVVAQNVIGASAHKHAVALTGSLQNGFCLKLEKALLGEFVGIEVVVAQVLGM